MQKKIFFSTICTKKNSASLLLELEQRNSITTQETIDRQVYKHKRHFSRHYTQTYTFIRLGHEKITNEIKIPTIGIGSSINCDGQILVTDDLIGLTDSKTKFIKKYTNIRKVIERAIKKFKNEVKLKKYPSNKHSY